MANENLNPISRLLDIDFPDFKRANWNNSFDQIMTTDIGFVKPIFVDSVMAGTRCTLDFDSASFANATKSPLYGRYKVKYLAIWAPHRLYMSDWLSGEKMEDDNYPYPLLTFPVASNVYNPNSSLTNILSPLAMSWTGATHPYVPPTSLMEFLGYYPSYLSADTFTNYPSKNAFAFLAFWDAYRTFILNPQEKTFPVRTRAFTPAYSYNTIDWPVGESDPTITTNTVQAEAPVDRLVQVSALDQFFKDIKAGLAVAINGRASLYFGFDLFPRKRVYASDVYTDTTYFDRDVSKYDLAIDYHYGCPIAPFMADPFTSFISNENVEIEKQKSTVKAQINGDYADFTMEQWYLASRIQSKVRRNLYKFNDFATWIDTNFGVKPSTTLTQPMFLGAFSSDVIFNDAVSTVQGDTDALGANKSLGSRAGYGVGRNGDRRNFFDFTALEPGTVMILQWILPEVHYFENTNPLFDTVNFNEEFNPIFDALGFQDMAKGTLNGNPALKIDPFGRIVKATPEDTVMYDWQQYNVSLGQQPYGFEHMCKPNQLRGMMTMPNYYQSWSLARSFNYNRSDPRPIFGSYDAARLYSTYPIPEMFNNIFANGQNVDNFQFYLSFNYNKYQPLSKQFLSFT